MPVANLRETSRDRVVAPEFLRKLKERDPALDLEWHPDTKRFILRRWIDEEVLENGLYVNKHHPIHVLTLRWPDGSFRDYGDWIFDWLNDSDLFNVDLETLLRNQEEVQERKRKDSIRASGEAMEHWVKDNRVIFNNYWSKRQRGLAGRL